MADITNATDRTLEGRALRSDRWVVVFKTPGGLR
jgi:hypothetical protein